MLSEQEQKRYSKQTILPEIGLKGQELLRAAKVLVVGAGGLGCPVLQYLTAAGVGTIGIADGDQIDLSNLQRQVLYTTQEIGSSKASIAAAKLSMLNPHVRFCVHSVYLDSSNALDIIKDYDIVVDGCDNFATRYLINDACVVLNKPMVSGAIYKFEGQISVFNLNGGPTYRCLFAEPPGAGESPNCADIGVVATLPGIVGTIQANEVIKVITGIGEPLNGRLMVIDTLTMNSHTFSFGINKNNLNITELTSDYYRSCDVVPQSITYEQLQAMLATTNLQLIDVREPEEHSTKNIGGINIPLSAITDRGHELSIDQPILIYCASGMRSKQATSLLQQLGFKDLYELKGGISQL